MDGGGPARPAPVLLVHVKSFDQLYAELALDAGVHTIGRKIVEEAAGVWMAAEYEGKDKTAEEISQLLYHLQVLMLATGLTPDDVYSYL